jgi:hypothetical protein
MGANVTEEHICYEKRLASGRYRLYGDELNHYNLYANKGQFAEGKGYSIG